MWVRPPSAHVRLKLNKYLVSSVFRAVNVQDHRVAACKLVAYPIDMPDKERKTIDKEMRVHSALKHVNVMEFLCAVIIDPRQKGHYNPGFYMLLEFAAGGDLFDKIGATAIFIHSNRC